MSRRFDGRVAVVVGGATGIGAATATRLASEGATVVVGDIDLDAGRRTVAEIAESGAAALAVEVDVARDGDVAALFERVSSELGRLDALHSNAADTRPETVGQDSNVVDIDLAVWDHVLQVVAYLLSDEAEWVNGQVLSVNGGALMR